MNIITPVDNTQSIRYADFVRITTRQNLYGENNPPMIYGKTYTILKVGTTDFTVYGAPVNAVNISFVCNAYGSILEGTGILALDVVYRFSSAPYPITVYASDNKPVYTGDFVYGLYGNGSSLYLSCATDPATLGIAVGQYVSGQYIPQGATIDYIDYDSGQPTYPWYITLNLYTTNTTVVTDLTSFYVSEPDTFAGLGQLVQTGSATRDIKSTANETTFTLVGIDTAMLGFVLGQKIKGSKIEAWHGFFNENNQLITNQYNQLLTSNFVGSWFGYCGNTTNVQFNNQPDPFGGHSATTIIRNTNTSCGSGTSWGLVFANDPASNFYTTGDVVTVSVWAKSNSPSETVTMNLGVDDANAQGFTLTTSWVRYSATFTIVPTGTGNRGFQFTINAPVSGTVSASVYGAQSQLGELTNYVPNYVPPTQQITSGLYKFFTGTINSFAIQEEWMEEIRSYVGVISISASSIQMILKNRIAGRYTNPNSWEYFTPDDKSMDRVAYVSNINYQFGKTP